MCYPLFSVPQPMALPYVKYTGHEYCAQDYELMWWGWDKKRLHSTPLPPCAVVYVEQVDAQCTTAHTARMTVVT